ncbi:MAG: methyltransferase domain-containing protein [Chloroflexi bacterium]|nr:MAG: methyltransferase domain-containing protein [Chloroflexota bacterium]
MIEHEIEQKQQTVQNKDDQLWRQLKSIPAFRAVLRAVEARFYQQLELAEPVLDLGCGDGHFAEMTFDKPLNVGLDPWWGPLQKSKKSGMYDDLVYGMGNDMPFPDETFASAFSNSVLEHIPDIQPVLNETSRVLQENGRFVITMPSNYFTEYMGGAEFFEKLGANGLANRYRNFFNTISRHAHTDTPEVWADRLAKAGFEIERWQYYFSKDALRALEFGHAQGVPSALMHAITGHWIVAPWKSSLQRTERWLRPFYEEAFNPEEGAYLLIIARKRANGPIDAPLPEPQPFSVEAMMSREAEMLGVAATDEQVSEVIDSVISVEREVVGETAVSTADEAAPIHKPETKPTKSGINILNYVLLLTSLLAAIVGQTMFGSNALEPSRGFGWIVFSALPLLILGWRTGLFQLPRLPNIQLPAIGRLPRRRWLVLSSLLLALFAQRAVGNPGLERPFWGFLLWFMAIGLGVYALASPQDPTEISTSTSNVDFNNWLLPLIFFLVAFGIRVVNLSEHPFILNGIEASLGLDVVRISNGTLQNPFGTGWLGNPTLSSFLMAIPVKILGPSVFSIRFWSPLIGAITVAIAYVIGKRLYGREVGIVTAVLLTGSHFHLHYSRLGMSNIWDPMLVLLALGITAVAWELTLENETFIKRRQWLWAGAFIGLNAYFFTSSHLLPIILAVLLVWAILFDRTGLRRNSSHLFAAAALALIVALPQLLYYNNNPEVYMQRANDLGIFPNQTDWLNTEAARTGENTNTILANQIWHGLLAFNGELDLSPAYRPLAPLLSFGPALFMVLGLVTAVFRLRDLKYVMLVVWFVVTTLFAGAFLLDVPNSHRLVIATPALSLLAGIALVTYGRFALSALPKETSTRFRSGLLPVLVVLSLLFVMGDLVFYYGRFRVEHNFGDRNTEIADGVADYLNDFTANEWTTYFYGPPSMYTDFPTIPFLAPEFQRGYNLFDVEPDGELPDSLTTNQLYIFLPERAAEMTQIQAQFPGGETQSFAGYYADPLFYVYEVEN